LLTFFRGNWDQARLGLQRAEAIRRQAGVAWESLAVSQGHVALAEGARDEAAQVLEDLEDCVTKLERSGWLVPLREAQRLLAERDLLEGCPDVAHTRLVPLLDRPGLEETGVTALLPLLAWAHLEL